MGVKNPYEGQSFEALKSLRRDVLNARKAHLLEAQRLMNEAHRIATAMREAPRENIGVSDHAVIRWLERSKGIDTNAVRAEILAHIHEFDGCGDGNLITGNGVAVVVLDGCRVTTVLTAPKEPRP